MMLSRMSSPLALLYRRIPALDSLRRYDAQTFRIDVLAGLSVAAVAVPQAMAYAMIAGLPAEYGLYTAIVRDGIAVMRETQALAARAAEGLPAAKRLRAYVRAFLGRVMHADGPSWIHKLMTREMNDPTPALELIDSRIAQWRIGIVDTVADNASSGMAVIGDWHDADDVRVEELGVSLALGPEIVRGRGDAVLGHPAEAVAWLASTLAQSGERLEPGDIVLPGSVARAVPIAAGQAAYATFDRLGEVSVGLV